MIVLELGLPGTGAEISIDMLEELEARYSIVPLISVTDDYSLSVECCTPEFLALEPCPPWPSIGWVSPLVAANSDPVLNATCLTLIDFGFTIWRLPWTHLLLFPNGTCLPVLCSFGNNPAYQHRSWVCFGSNLSCHSKALIYKIKARPFNNYLKLIQLPSSGPRKPPLHVYPADW